MPETPEPLAGDLVAAIETLGEVFEARGIQYALLGGVATILPGLLDALAGRGFTIDRQAAIREFVQHHMTTFRFGVVRIASGSGRHSHAARRESGRHRL